MRGVAVIAVALMLTSPSRAGEVVTFSTSDSRFFSDMKNQGWWQSPGLPTHWDSYYTGQWVSYGHVFERRSYFTFDLSYLSQDAISAKLEVTRFGYLSSAATEVLGLFDVSTEAAPLNFISGRDTAIFSDIGTGTSYGSFVIDSTGAEADTLSFELNAAAVADINASRGGFFSIGGRLMSIDGTTVVDGHEALFSNSGDGTGIQQLVVEIPEPATLALLALGGVALVRRRRRTHFALMS